MIFYHDSHWRNVNVTEKMTFLICVFKWLPLEINRHKETAIKMFIAYINLLYFGAFFIIVASIVLRQLFLQEIW